MAAPIMGGIARTAHKEKAAQVVVVAHPATEASFDAGNQNNCNPAVPASTGGFPKADAFTLAQWEAAFPGQAILPDGRPNRERRAMHCARAMIRAVVIDDIVVAEVFRRGMDRAYAPLPPAEGRKE